MKALTKEQNISVAQIILARVHAFTENCPRMGILRLLKSSIRLEKRMPERVGNSNEQLTLFEIRTKSQNPPNFVF